ASISSTGIVSASQSSIRRLSALSPDRGVTLLQHSEHQARISGGSFMKHLQATRKVAAAGLILGLLAGAAPALSHIPAAAAARQGAARGKVGFLFSDFTPSARWAFDRDFYIAALKGLDPAATVSVQDAKNSQTTQQNEAQSLLTAGVKVLI